MLSHPWQRDRKEGSVTCFGGNLEKRGDLLKIEVNKNNYQRRCPHE